MDYSTQLCLLLTSLLTADCPHAPHQPSLPEVLEPAEQRLHDLVTAFREQPLSPQAAYEFEQHVRKHLQEIGRLLLQWTFNHLEPHDSSALPQHVTGEGIAYTRLRHKTPTTVATSFGDIRLSRTGYRSTHKTGDPTIFPLAQHLGIVHGVTPALAERVAHYQAEAGATQQQTLQRLRQAHGIGWGVKKLRQVTATLATALDEQRHEVQVTRLLGCLTEAAASRGRHPPVLSVGRDGIHLGLQGCGCDIWEVASTATVTVLNRRGQRLGTIYLAYVPESKQPTLSAQLTRLLTAVLAQWTGCLPQLCYVTDAGDNETAYYDQVLRRMRHPRTGERLTWIRVVDYYHASERLTTMAEALFGPGRAARAWAGKMRKLLLQVGGISRVLHSAAALRQRRSLPQKRASAFQRAYNYLRERRCYLRYAEYRRQGLPLGSGITEAACKTVYTQRLKLSGMRWKKAGAQTILNLRVLLLSGVWDQAYARVLQIFPKVKILTSGNSGQKKAKKAA
jgi:hypothetical protein